MIIAKNSRFGLLWSSQLLSNIGDWLMIVAIPVFVYHLTGSALSTGMAIIAEIVPAMVLGPFAGVFVDRWNRQVVMVVSEFLRAVTVLAMLFVDHPSQLWILLLAVFMENCIGQFFAPAHRALVPDVVGRGPELESANSWYAVSSGVVRLAGGAVGGALYVLLGFKALVLIDSATFLMSGLLILAMGRMRTPKAAPATPNDEPAAPSSFFLEFKEGLSYLVGHRMLRGLLIVSSLFLLANSVLNVLLVPYLISRVHATEQQVGLLMSALGVGYLLSAYVGKVASASGRLRGAALSFLITITVFFAGLFYWHHFATAILFMALVGLSGGALLLLIEVQLQRQTPDAVLGRVSAAFGTTEMTATLIGAIAGGLVGAANLSAAIQLSLIVMVAAVAAAIFLLPSRIAGSTSEQEPQPEPEPVAASQQ